MHVVGPNLIDHIKLQVAVLTLPPIGERSTMTLSVCVCLSEHISGNTRPIFTKFFVHVMYGHSLIRYVLPVLWMTSYLGISQRS